MRVLIIDDDRTMCQSFGFWLKNQGMTVDTAFSGDEGFELARLYEYDIILLDLMLSDMSGIDVLKRLRSGNIMTPVMVISAIQVPAKKIDCFLSGADDYVVKPFDRGEVLARMRAIIRRACGHAGSRVEIGKMVVDMESKIVTIAGKVLHLTAKEYALIELLCLRKGMTVSKTQFLNHLYGGMDDPDIKIINVFLFKIRKKIQKLSGGCQYIQTVWGRGYILKETTLDKVEK